MRWLWWCLLALIVAVAAALVGAVASKGGSRWFVERAVAASGTSIELSGLDGTLLQGLRAGMVTIHAGGTSVEVKDLELVPTWRATLLRRAVVIDRLAAATLRVVSQEAKAPSPISVALPSLPFALDVRVLQIDATQINDLPGEYAPSVRGRVSYDGGVYAMSGLELRAAAYSVDGDLLVTASADVAVNGELNWRLTEPALTGRVQLRNSLRALDVALRVDEPGVDARGLVRVLGEVQPRFDLEGSMAQWRSDRISVAGLSADLVGTLEHFEVRATAAINVPDLPPAQVALEAAGTFDALDIARLSLASDQGGAVAHGRVARTPEWSADLTADIDNLDPALFLASLSGGVSGRVELRVRGNDLDVTLGSLAGRLNDAPFEAKGHIARSDDRWSASGVEMRSGPNLATLTLDWHADQVSGQARLNMPNLATLLPELHGDLVADVAVSGKRDAPNAEVAASSKSLRYREWRADAARLEATVKDGASGNARVSIARASRNDLQITRVDGTVRGSLDALTGSFGWSLADQRGSVELSARKDGDRWSVTVAEGAVLTLPDERWRLDRDVEVKIAGSNFDISQHCWLPPSSQGRVCVDAAVAEDDHIRMAGAIDGLDIAGIAHRFEDAQRVAGRLSGHWDVVGDKGRWRGSARLKTGGLRLLDEEGSAGSGVDLPELSASVDLRDDRAEVTLHADNDTARVLNAELTVNGFDSSATLDGRATVSVRDLGFLATFTRRVGETGGALDGEFVIAGTVAAPDVRGTLTISNGRIALTEPRVELTSILLTMRLSGAQRWTIDGTALSDKGRVTVNGAVRDPLQDSRTFHARVDAADLPLSIPDATARVAGGVDVDWRPGLFSVKGRVEIPRAEIKLSSLPAGAVAVSEDVVVINRVEVHPGGTRLEVDLEVVLQDHVHFTAFGLDTGLTGTLRLRQSAEGIVQLNGTLTLIDGVFEVYGQKLAIESGRLTYSGPPQDPYVDATASRTIREPARTVTVSARIQGPARAIETTLVSQPAMSEAETLAYLVLGRPLSSATAQEGNNVMGAAIALGLEGASPVIKEVSDVLHIDELTATGGSTEDLTVVAGKRFSDRIFVRYSYQTFTRMSAILFELMLSRRLALEATASDIPAIDVIYKVGEND
jgi:translocation and assembly module TamB